MSKAANDERAEQIVCAVMSMIEALQSCYATKEPVVEHYADPARAEYATWQTAITDVENAINRVLAEEGIELK